MKNLRLKKIKINHIMVKAMKEFSMRVNILEMKISGWRLTKLSSISILREIDWHQEQVSRSTRNKGKEAALEVN